MFLTKKRYNAIIENTQRLERHIGVVLSDIENYQSLFKTANKYNTRQLQVTETIKKYKGIANFGNQILQRLINLRVAFSVPNRLFLIKNPITKATDTQIKETKEYLNLFLSFNKLDTSLPRDLTKQSELEGQVLIRLKWNNEEKLPSLLYYSSVSPGYKIEPINKYYLPSNIEIKVVLEEARKEETVTDNEIVFIAFNDELNSYVGHPSCGGILATIENLDKDLQDWRKLNHLFGHLTPHFKCETTEEAEAINQQISAKGWKVGTAIATNAEFALKGPGGSESNMLMLAIQTDIKIISGHTGIGPHFLGFANVMSNRATADSMGEPTEVVLHSEITSWTNFYTELFKKVLIMRNKKLNSKLVIDAILPKLVPLTDRQWRVIKDVFLPLAEKGKISDSTLLSRLPEIDPDVEKEKIKEEEEERRKSKEKLPQVEESDDEESSEEDDSVNSESD